MMRLRNRLTRPAAGTPAGGDERGSVTLENIIIWPAVMIFMFGFFQFALWLHARDLAHGAATAAYYEARLYDGTVEDGQAVGYEAIAAGNGTIEAPQVTVLRSATTVEVTVTGTTSLVIEGWPGSTISETVTGPTERYVAP
jgi:hypothetical protein